MDLIVDFDQVFIRFVKSKVYFWFSCCARTFNFPGKRLYQWQYSGTSLKLAILKVKIFIASEQLPQVKYLVRILLVCICSTVKPFFQWNKCFP